MREAQRALGGVVALAALLIVGAATLKLAEQGQPPPTGGVRWFLSTDWVHVPAHLLLYGALALCCAFLFGGLRWPTALAVAAVALAQEACQSLLFGRAPGWPEAFDLAVDAVALVAGLGWYQQLQLSPQRRRGTEQTK